MRYFILIITFVLGASTVVNCQNSKEAFKSYNELKAGVLLIRLEDYSRAIEKLEDLGHYNRIAQLEEQGKSEAEEIINDFKNSYFYSDYAFFYAKDIDNVLDNSKTEFIDTSGKQVQFASEIPKFICKKEILNYTSGSFNKYYHIYGIKNNAIYRMPKPFKTDYRIPFFIRLFNKDQYANEAEYLDFALTKEFEKYNRRVNSDN